MKLKNQTIICIIFILLFLNAYAKPTINTNIILNNEDKNSKKTEPFLITKSTLKSPSPPTGVSATDGRHTDKIVISWNASSGASWYRVYRNTSDSPKGSATLGPWQYNQVFNDNSATPGYTYYYFVRAAKSSSGDDSSDYSDSDSGWRKLLPPSTVTASQGEYDDKIVISWNSSSGAKYYRVYRNEKDNTSGLTALSSYQTQRNFYDETAIPGKTYYYFVKAAMDLKGQRPSDYSASSNGWRNLLAPEKISASDGLYNDKILITWNSVKEASHYRVYRNTKNEANSAAACSQWISDTSYTNITADQGKIYYYWIKAAVNSSGDRASKLGEYDGGYCGCIPPSNVTASQGLYTDKVKITWSPTDGATHYRLFRRPARDNTYPIPPVSNWISDTSYIDKNIRRGIQYSYYLKAAKSSNGEYASIYSYAYWGWLKLKPPQHVNASDGKYTNHIEVFWRVGDVSNMFRVYRSTNDSSSTKKMISDWNENTIIYDYNVKLDSVYFYWVRGTYNHSIYSDYSSLDTGYIQFPPLPPNLISPKDSTIIDTSQNILLEWAKVKNVKNYQVIISENEEALYPILISQIAVENYFYSEELPYGKYYWKVLSINNAGRSDWSNVWSFTIKDPLAIEDKKMEFIKAFKLVQNFPNPFNPTTAISYQLPAVSLVDLSIYNVLGQKISTLVNGKQKTGIYTVEWNAAGFSSGVYFYRMETDKGFVQSRKLILLK